MSFTHSTFMEGVACARESFGPRPVVAYMGRSTLGELRSHGEGHQWTTGPGDLMKGSGRNYAGVPIYMVDADDHFHIAPVSDKVPFWAGA